MGLTQNLGQAPHRVAVGVMWMLRVARWIWLMRGLSHCSLSPIRKEMLMQKVVGPNGGSKTHWDTQFASVHANFRSRSCWNYVWLFGPWWKMSKMPYSGLYRMSLNRKSANSGFSKDRLPKVLPTIFWGLDLEIFTEFRRTSLPPTGFPKSYQQCFGASIWIYSLNLVGHQHPLYRRTSSVSSCLGSLAWCWEAPAEPLQKGVQGQRHAVVWAWRILHSM